MKQELIMMILGIVLSIPLSSQGVHIGSTNSDPEPSAILELESTSKGILIPRMTSAQMRAISSPAEGLMVFNTDSAKLGYYNGTRWLNGDGSTATLEVGDPYQGGVIFEVDGTGIHGKIAATADVGTAIPWGCQGTAITSGNGAESTTDGSANTAAIMADCGEAGSAAELCDSYSVVEGGDTYDDWYLPAEDEMLTLYSERVAVGGFNGSDYYWTSTESSKTKAVMVDFNSGNTRGEPKDDTDSWFGSRDHNTRPIRAF